MAIRITDRKQTDNNVKTVKFNPDENLINRLNTDYHSIYFEGR